MCRIAVIVSRKPKLKEAQIQSLLVELENYANKDAAGIGYLHHGQFAVTKDPGPATLLVKRENFQRAFAEASDSKLVFLHARAATNGDPKDNRNNHPIAGEFSWIIHNGIVSPHKGNLGSKSSDTKYLLDQIEAHGIKKGIGRVEGWLAIAWYSRRDPHNFYFYRYGAPLDIALCQNYVFLASDIECITEAIKPRLRYGFIPMLQWATIPEGIVYRFNLEKFRLYEEAHVEPQVSRTPRYQYAWANWTLTNQEDTSEKQA